MGIFCFRLQVVCVVVGGTLQRTRAQSPFFSFLILDIHVFVLHS